MVSDISDIQVLTLAQWSKGEDWRSQLAHDLPHALLVWITRGQGRVLFDGMRRGLGAHNALFIPAGTLFAIDLGRQSLGHVVALPVASSLRLPQMPRHLRIRDAQVQSDLTALIEAAQREHQMNRPLAGDALEGHAALISVWLRRQLLLDTNIPDPRTAGERLSQRFCHELVAQYASGTSVSDYAKALGVTPTHLSRAVKAATGKTAADLVAERTLHEARRLLLETTLPAKRIAGHLGFGSAAYFTRFIQQHTGQTPSKLRGT